MSGQSLKDKTVKGLAWSVMERFSVQGIQFLVMLFIARLLTPKDFGLVGMLAIFIAVSQSIADSGFSQALIRKQGRTETDNSTVFYFNIVVSVCLYALLFLCAPYVSLFYEEPELTSLMRVLSLIVIINGFVVVQRAIFTASIDFKTQAKASLLSAIISGVIGAYLAYVGYGAWALVWQQLLNAGANTTLLWLFSKWRPKLLYSWESFRELFAFGSKLMASSLLDTLYNNIYQLVIGKVFTAASLGHFTQAKTFTALPSSNISNIIQRVTYPVLCTLQNDDERLRVDYRKLLRLSAFVIFPLMCGLAGIAHPLVNLLIGEKWDFAATLIMPLSFSLMWYPIHAINLNLLQVKGRSDLFLRLEIIKKTVGVVVLVVSIPFGLVFMCWCRIVTSLIALVINTYYTGKLIQVGFFIQMKDLMPTLIASIVTFGIVYYATAMVEGNLLKVILGVVVGIIAYIVMAVSSGFKEIEYIKTLRK